MHLNSKLECPNKPTMEQVNELKEILHKFKMKTVKYILWLCKYKKKF